MWPQRILAHDNSRAHAGPRARYRFSIFSNPKGCIVMKRLAAAALVLAFVGFVSPALGAEDPTGTWKWTVTFNNNSFDATLKLKLEGDKLTGTMPGRDNQETPISDATFKDNKVSFSVTREINGQKRTTKYNGTVAGDTITGKSERERDGQTTSTDWVAKRQK
jgi:hypothetical protein